MGHHSLHGCRGLDMTGIRTRDDQIELANASGRTPVVFVHGLWVLPASWIAGGPSRDCRLLDGRAGLADDPETSRGQCHPRSSPEAIKTSPSLRCGDPALNREAGDRRHSFGGLMTRSSPVAGCRRRRWRLAGAVRGVLPLPSLPSDRVRRCHQPAQRGRAVPLTYDSSLWFANAVSETRRASSKTRTRSRHRASPCSRPRSPTSIRGRGQGRHEEPRAWAPPIPTAESTTPCPGRSRTASYNRQKRTRRDRDRQGRRSRPRG